ncbi:MAG TPA: sugar kinase [Polyangiaceae bacterium]|jgi:2-dehydro-3-deoxygluconokinase|nr:sugar kinase [Polyangiaceae bacterium]
MKKTVTFGEIMLRLSSPGFERLLQSPDLLASFGGGEANVALSLARLGLESHYVTRLPNHPLGDAALRVLRAEGVRTEHVARGGERIGIYFVETGASQRPSVVLYDRAHSAITELEPEAVDWQRMFEGAHWFHITGITPALGPKPQACTRAALQAAKRAGVTVSMDVNYRSKLWPPEEAQRVLRPLLEFVEILIANEEDLELALGVPVPSTNLSGTAAGVDGYHWAAERVAREFGIQMVAMTRRERVSPTEYDWSGMLYEHASSRLFQSEHYPITLVDPIGAGDSFAAGLIYAVVIGRSAEHALAFAVAASALKQAIPGDYNQVSAAEVDRLVSGDRSGRVQR